MKNHIYVAATGGPCQECGKQLHHEEHFGGSREQATRAYREDSAATKNIDTTMRETTVATSVRIRRSHPRYPDRKGIVTHVDETLCQVQLAPVLDQDIDDAPVLPMSFPWCYIEILPLIVPAFSSAEQADEWLERHNPVSKSVVPHFVTVEEADAWVDGQQAAAIERHYYRLNQRITPERFPPEGFLLPSWP